MAEREKIPAWVLKGDKQIMLRCIPPTAMKRFKIVKMFWLDGMSVLDIATALDMTEHAVTMILHRLRKKA